MANSPAPNVLDVAAVRSADPKTIGEVFNQYIIHQSRQEDVLGQMEGNEGSGKPVCCKKDLTKGKGDRVHFTSVSPLSGSGKRGTEVLKGAEEKPRHHTFKVVVDQLRHAVGYSELITHLMSVGYSLEGAYAKLLASWFSNRKQEDGLMLWRTGATATNTIRPNNRSTTNALTPTDTFDAETVTNAVTLLKTLGGKPANLTAGKKGQAPIKGYTVFGSDILLKPLKADSAYLSALQNADQRGENNTLFRGGYSKWDGNYIYHWDVQDPDAHVIGAPILPKAHLGVEIEAIATRGTTAFDVKGSGVLHADLDDATYYHPFKWFKGYPYKFISSVTPSADTDTHYFVIYNMTGANAGKYGVYSYTGSGNTGDKITVDGALGAAAAGIVVTTLAGQTWDSNIHTDTHPVGSIIIPVNNQCTQLGWGMVLAEMSLLRCYGSIPMKRIIERDDYDEQKAMGIKSIYGQGLAVDSQGQPRNFVLIEAAVEHHAVNLTYA